MDLWRAWEEAFSLGALLNVLNLYYMYVYKINYSANFISFVNQIYCAFQLVQVGTFFHTYSMHI